MRVWRQAGADLAFQVCVSHTPRIGAAPTPPCNYTDPMPTYHRHFEPGQLQFITTSTYHRAGVFADSRYCQLFADALQAARAKFQFKLIGWVLMPDHFHVLLQPPLCGESTSAIVKDIKQRSAFAVLEALRAESDLPSSRALLRSLRLPPTVHDHAHYRLWQRRFVPFNVFTEKKS